MEILNGVETSEYDTIFVPVTAMTPRTTNGPATGTKEYATNDVMMDYLAYDSSTEEFADFDITMPEDWDRSTIKVKFYWTGASGCSADFRDEAVVSNLAVHDCAIVDP